MESFDDLVVALILVIAKQSDEPGADEKRNMEIEMSTC